MWWTRTQTCTILVSEIYSVNKNKKVPYKYNSKISFGFVITLGLMLIALGQFPVLTQEENEQVATDSANVSIRVTGTLEDHKIEAVDDYAITDQGSLVTIDVLANDQATRSLIDKTSLKVVTNPANGVVEIDNNQINYQPNNNFYGNDQFRYEICNTQMACDEANVFVEVKRIIPTNPEPKPEPEPQPPLVPLPITGGAVIATISAMSSAVISLFGVWFFILRKKNFYDSGNGSSLHKLKRRRNRK
jgi:hypothetical protein